MEKKLYTTSRWLKFVYSWEVSDKLFIEKYKDNFDEIYTKQELPSVDWNYKNKAFCIAFEGWIWYLQSYDWVIVLIENSINEIDYYPTWWEHWDPIPEENQFQIYAAKIWVSYQTFIDWIKLHKIINWKKRENKISIMDREFQDLFSVKEVAQVHLYVWDDSWTNVYFYNDWWIYIAWNWCDCKEERIWDCAMWFRIPKEEVEKLVKAILEKYPWIADKVNYKDWKDKVVKDLWWTEYQKFIYSLLYLAFWEIDSYYRIFKFCNENDIKYTDYWD